MAEHFFKKHLKLQQRTVLTGVPHWNFYSHKIMLWLLCYMRPLYCLKLGPTCTADSAKKSARPLHTLFKTLSLFFGAKLERCTELIEKGTRRSQNKSGINNLLHNDFFLGYVVYPSYLCAVP